MVEKLAGGGVDLKVEKVVILISTMEIDFPSKWSAVEALVGLITCRNMCECERVNCVHEMWLYRSLYTWDCSAE